MLETGEIDALYTARAPSTFFNGSGKVRRLFEDYPTVEREYYRKTKIFPPMHIIAIRRDVYEQNRVGGAVALQGVRRGAKGSVRRICAKRAR